MFIVTIGFFGLFSLSPAAVLANTVGTAPGQFSVSPTGAATYQIPLDLPPGVNGLKPSLALLYNSQAGNGILGEGWSLTGLSVISRCPQTLDQDNAIHIPDGTGADRLCLDGQRLIVTSGNYGAAGSVYHTEIESFQQVTASSSMAGGSPKSFTVVDRSGLTRIYSTVPFTCTSTCPNGAALEWLITNITDRYGNFITFQYDVNSFNGGNFPGAFAVSEIDYGSTSGTVAKVLFQYDGGNPGNYRSDSYSQFVGATGYAVSVNAVMLTSIVVQNGNGSTLRTYTLNYNPIPATPVSPLTLANVQECGSDGTCFNPTSFTYSGAPTAFNSGGAVVLLGLPAGYQVADFDGDGLTDFIYANGCTVDVLFGTNLTTPVAVLGSFSGNGCNGGIGFGLQQSVVTNLNGNGQQELLVPYYSHPGLNPNTPTWYLLKWNGQAGSNANLTLELVPTTSGGTIYACASDDGCTPDAVAVDMTGNGEPGILFADGGQLYYYANVSGSLSSSPTATGISYSGSMPKLTPVNYDGQATPEVYVAGTGVVKWNRNSGTFQLIPGNFDESDGYSVQFINANGDGLSSAVVMTGSNWWYCPNTGQGFGFLSQQVGNPNACSESAGALSGEDFSQAQPVDYYGDGRQEILVPDTSSSTWYLFNGVTFTALNVSQVPYEGSPTQFVDVNGDGRQDMILSQGSGNTEIYFNANAPYLLNQVTDGLGQNTDVGYIPIDQATHNNYVSGVGSSVISPPQIRAYMGPMYVVDDFAVDTGVSNSNGPEQIYTYYIYAGAALDQWGRGFLGFSEVEAINYNTGLYTEATYDQAFPYTGMVATSSNFYDSSASHNPPNVGAGGVNISCSYTNPAEPDCEVNYTSSPPLAAFTTGGVTLSTTSNTGLTNIAPYSGTQVRYPYVGLSTTLLYDLSGANYETTSTSSTYQTVGTSPSIGTDIMPTDVTVTTSATDPGNTTTTATVNTTTTYGEESTCPGHATQVSVTDSFGGSTAPAKTESFQYDGNCFLTTDTKTIVGLTGGGSMTLTKQYAPDGFGNPLSSTVSGTSAASRTTGISYDPTERFPVTISNALGQNESLTYNDWGEKLSDTDDNGDTVTYNYDGFGRKLTQSGPEPAVYTNWGYSSCSGCVSGAVYEVTQTGSDGSQLATQYDELGRALRSVRLGFGGESVIQDTQYDLLGRVSQTSVPFKSGQTECWDTKTYDVLNRVTQETQPYNATTTSPCGSTRTIGYGYNGLQTTKTITAAGTNVGSEQITTTLNALGKPAKVADAGGTTTYSYTRGGNLISVTPPDGNTVSMSYDSASDKLSMHDPDMGAWSYTYDALGELLSQTDAKNQTVSNQYDVLGRLVSRTEPEGTTIWKYDIAYGAGVGRLAYTEGPNGVWEGYAYDAYGNPTDKITVVNGQEYWVTTTYDDQGRVSQVVYPNLTGINTSGTPAVPTGLSASVDPNDGAQIDLAWTLAQDGEIYHLYRTPSGATAPTDADEIYSGPDANWVDQAITINGTYKWWLKACNDTNCSSYATTTLAVSLPPTVPGTPQIPSSDQHTLSFNISWTGSSLVSTTVGPITYNLDMKHGSAAFSQAYSGTATQTPVSISYDGNYRFEVQACASGACSAFSPVSSDYRTYIQPSAPQDLTVPSSVTPTSSPAAYTVSWSAPAVQGTQVTYQLQEELGSNGFTTIYSGTNTTSPTISHTQDGKYTYQVIACDPNETALCGPAAISSAVAVTLPPTNPGAPTPPASDQTASSWAVTWVASTLNTGSSGSISYQLQQSLNGGAFSSVSGTPTESGSIWTLWATAVLTGGVYQNGTYTYELRACTTDPATGGTACTVWVVGGSYATIIMPGPAGNLSVPSESAWNGSFTVTYTAPVANSGGPVSSYKVQLGEYDSETETYLWIDGSCTSTSTSCLFTADQITPGSYLVRVKAYDQGVASLPTPNGPPYPSVTIWHESPPAAPSLGGPSQTTTGSIALGWSAPSTATSYQLYWSYAHATGPWSAFSEIYSGSSTSYTTTVGKLDKYNLFYVVACNPAGCSGASNEVEVIYNLQGGCKTCAPTAPPSPPPPASSSGDSPSFFSGVSPAPGGDLAMRNVAAPVRSELSTPVVATLTPTAVSISSDMPLPLPAVSVSAPIEIAETLAMLPPPRLPAALYQYSTRAVFFLVHANQSTRPRTKPAGFASNDQVQWPPPALDPRLSLYPPLRRDPRVLRHFESLGGELPGRIVLASDSQPPGGTVLMVGYVYNSAGYLAQVQRLNPSGNPNWVLWEATDETAQGQVDQEAFDAANGSSAAFSITNTYDAASGMLDATMANAGPAGDTLNASYAWDGYNNLLNRGVSESVGTGTAPPALNEAFTYDGLNRLTYINNSVSTVYNPNGNATFSSNGVYTNFQYSNPSYTVSGYTYSQPHAVSSLTLPGGGTRSFTYDADGNLLTETGDVNRSVTWTSYNKPSQIIGGGVTETFTYGPDRERLIRVESQGSDTQTTTYIDGLFEEEYDSATGDFTYRHYILAGGVRVGVKTMVANSGGTITANTWSFYVHDEVGSVIATVTENLGGSGQTMSLASYDAWGKQRPTTGANAYTDPVPGTYFTPTPVGQHEGYAGHEDMDPGLVDMEGRVYDPEVGMFLSPDPNVQYPFSSQGYSRYTYVNDNPLSLSDPSGYFMLGGFLSTGDPMAGFFPQQYGQVIGIAGPIVGAALNVIPVCEGWCDYLVTAVSQAQAGYLETGSIGAGLRSGVLGGAEAFAFTYVGGQFGVNPEGTDLLERSVVEGVIGGAFSSAGGGRFSDGFIGAFAGSLSSGEIGQIGGNPNEPGYFSAANESTRVVLSMLVGGTTSHLTGGNFTEGALAAAFQRIFNDDEDARKAEAARKAAEAQTELVANLRQVLFGVDEESGLTASQEQILGAAIELLDANKANSLLTISIRTNETDCGIDKCDIPDIYRIQADLGQTPPNYRDIFNVFAEVGYRYQSIDDILIAAHESH
ncbi:MAG: RHS repeat-associated core domain-containing protein [Gammaproteobacteria bacterium]